MQIDEIRANAPDGATHYYINDVHKEYVWLRKTPKTLFYKLKPNGRWWKVPLISLRELSRNMKPLN